ncbi:pentatricopeptide repeat-containing protein, putative [Ricinus communis]|uniref:Pentatricopeptide repeat-containing protein, putative n=1 Tax=Ricinus communis TaxID=3988 RepID=B9SHR7_RICCO|nr:pentatricopeptide repeat-containing protein, putative [Ricinus communis]
MGLSKGILRYEGYTSQGLNLYLFSYPGYGSLRLYSVSSSDASLYKKLHTDELRPKATRKQVSVIIGLLITEDNELETKLNSLGVRLSIGSVRWVFQVLNREKKSALQFFHWIRRWQPELEGNSDICSLVIDNCGHLDDYKAMRCLLDGFSLQRLFLTKKAFEYLQLTSSKEELLKKATQNVVDILQEIGGTSYGTGVPSLIEMFSDLGSFDMAKFVIEKTGRKLSYYNVLIRELCRRGDFKAARDLMDEIGKEGCNPSAHTYNYIISSLLKNGKNADACEVFQEMQDNDCPPDALTFEIFIYNSCNEGKLDNAFEFFDDMVARGLEPRLLTHAAFIKGFFNSQQYEKAYKYVVGSDDKYSSNVNYSLLANLHQKQGNLVDAENILSEMIKKGLRPHFNVFMKVKKHLMKSGNEELATSLQKKFLQLEVRA